MKKLFTLFFFSLIIFWGCEHNPFPGPPNSGMDPIDTNSTNGFDTVYFQSQIQPIFSRSCSFAGCHDDISAVKSVILISYEETIFSNIIDPFRPDHSKLYEVIVETDLSKRMPYLRPALPPNEIQLIHDWIEQGAENYTSQSCDSLNLTYSNGIQEIFDINCATPFCHNGPSPRAGLKLTTYNEVVDALTNTNLIARINEEPGAPVMPQGGKMTPCNIDKIVIWNANGRPQ